MVLSFAFVISATMICQQLTFDTVTAEFEKIAELYCEVMDSRGSSLAELELECK
jgi:hypothetical protein